MRRRSTRTVRVGCLGAGLDRGPDGPRPARRGVFGRLGALLKFATLALPAAFFL